MNSKTKIFNLIENGEVAEVELKGLIGVDSDEFTANTRDRMKSEIQSIVDSKCKSILLKIGSIGGSVGHSDDMRNDLKRSGVTLDILYFEDSASAALVFGSIARKVSIFENVMLLIHEARGDIESASADGMESTAKLIRNLNNNIIAGYVAQSKRAGKNKTADYFREIMRRNDNRGEWLGAAELFEAGLVNEILPAFDAINVAKFNNSDFKNGSTKKEPQPNKNNMKKKEEEALNLMNKAIKSFKNIFNPQNLVLQTEAGKELDFGAEITDKSEIEIGTPVTVDGESGTSSETMPDGLIYEIENGKISEIKKPEAPEETMPVAEHQEVVNKLNLEIKALKGASEANLAVHEATKLELTNAKNEALELKNSFKEVETQFNELKNTFTPEKNAGGNPPKVEDKKDETKNKFSYKKK